MEHATSSAGDISMEFSSSDAFVPGAPGETHTFPNGDTYTGEWTSSPPYLFNGHGKYTVAATGASYEGEWHASQRHGKGTYVHPV